MHISDITLVFGILIQSQLYFLLHSAPCLLDNPSGPSSCLLNEQQHVAITAGSSTASFSDDWFKVKSNREEAILTAFVMKKCIISYAQQSKGFPTKTEWELGISMSTHPLIYMLERLNWYKRIKDRIKNMVLRLRSKQDIEEFERYAALAESLDG